MLITCKVCKEDKWIDEFPKDKYKLFGIRTKCKACTKAYTDSRKETRNAIHREWRKNNKDKTVVYRKKHYETNKDKKWEYKRNKRANDPFYRTTENIRGRVRGAFNITYWKKGGATEQLLGADYPTVFRHIISLFGEGMCLELLGSRIHIDHIIPLSSATTEDELKTLCHYKNLQPLWAEDNIRKSNIIDEKFKNTHRFSLDTVPCGIEDSRNF